ncbi:flagellar biosynthesis protein FliQ [Acetanaerobacterium elongatum]|jgi:flagellar biosynthetic protein FliQ|uniref:Flagellar biosynthetic protein FliQ n=1 Tax=Acetanaerobacterium elongatum TaxID=258515 RepID=A0A1G9ZEC7_9FIRM|nr:flagellar biosynthesis protein FliQ [Acetanaerobacterium elongatum]SDN19790.1 flagellar biosynthetic protein FliQ [Acetanaerobacterium elongatum]
MDQGEAISILKDAVFTALKLSAPILIVSIAVGFIISVLQAATQIHEQTLTFVPKLVAIALVLLLLASWMMTTMSDFTQQIFSMMAAS